ncbi:MAG: hypothetical protein A2Z42_02495 [Candidatus Woykebacteria bacterium RBG_19FT_COMBO_43_10]|uniref:Phosphatidic acid phosphatase type 2/haloperoxidase domain-containing protein n=1 Tax=Candidatus Woykebacteria bacterium RBG_19FT_COMBO_43_10 TaxID=1802598 RepID=A0A1G1WK03_9BACT|nr:MAG: hypothetical protein A2Z42_02495 [Candidatus Woykebacteria bacterium RBG_19FT_COMBO_43_10]
MNAFAIATTKILNPLTTGLATILVVVGVQQIPLAQKVLWLVLGFLITFVPSLVWYWDFRAGRLSSLWSPPAIERRKAFLAWTLAAAVFSLVAFGLGAPRLILALGIVLLFLGLLNLLLTSSFKISVHGEMITLFVLVAILSVSAEAVYLALLIPLVVGSRLYLKAHDLSEASFGVLASIIIVYFVFSFFGLATF